MELERSPAVQSAPAVSAPEVGATGAATAPGTSNQSLLAALGLSGGAALPPVSSLAALLPSLGPVGAVVLDALPVCDAVSLASENQSLEWAREWLQTADELTGRAGAPAPLPGAPTTQAEALAEHVVDVARVEAVFNSARSITPDANAGASRPALLKNSVEWVDAGEAECVVLSPTHDGQLRGGPANHHAYFDARAPLGAPAAYDPALDAAGLAKDNSGIVFQFPGVMGSMDGTTLTLYSPASFSEAELVETLIHEVQHDADQTGGAMDLGEAPGLTSGNTAPNMYYETYRSEFNAYSLEEPAGCADDDYASEDGPATQREVVAMVSGKLMGATTEFWNARQASIFAQLISPEPPDHVWIDPSSDRWATPYAYVAHYFVADPNFRRMVNNLDVVRSGNRVNSPRIQTLWDAIEAHDDPAIDAAVAALDPLDVQTLGSGSTAGEFWLFAKRELPDGRLQGLRDGLHDRRAEARAAPAAPGECGPVAAGSPGTVVVQAGDTLVRLAERYLGGPERVSELAELNEIELGTEDEVLRPGQSVRLPPS